MYWVGRMRWCLCPQWHRQGGRLTVLPSPGAAPSHPTARPPSPAPTGHHYPSSQRAEAGHLTHLPSSEHEDRPTDHASPPHLLLGAGQLQDNVWPSQLWASLRAPGSCTCLWPSLKPGTHACHTLMPEGLPGAGLPWMRGWRNGPHTRHVTGPTCQAFLGSFPHCVSSRGFKQEEKATVSSVLLFCCSL